MLLEVDPSLDAFHNKTTLNSNLLVYQLWTLVILLILTLIESRY